MPAAHHQGAKMDVAKRTVVKGSSQQTCRSGCRSKQRIPRCNALEPVLEHYEAPSEKAISGATDAPIVVKKGKSRRVLAKLRDGYVKLMNDMAAGADLSGVSSFYGCPGADYAVFDAANATLQKEEQEKKAILQALQLQHAHSRLFC